MRLKAGVCRFETAAVSIASPDQGRWKFVSTQKPWTCMKSNAVRLATVLELPVKWKALSTPHAGSHASISGRPSIGILRGCANDRLVATPREFAWPNKEIGSWLLRSALWHSPAPACSAPSRWPVRRTTLPLLHHAADH